jgi:predicted DNA-binding transcriptional regulator AlpA
MINPKTRMVWMSTELIAALQISSRTFYRHVSKLGIRPKKKAGSRARWWDYSQAMAILSSIYRTPRRRAELYFDLDAGRSMKYSDS